MFFSLFGSMDGVEPFCASMREVWRSPRPRALLSLVAVLLAFARASLDGVDRFDRFGEFAGHTTSLFSDRSMVLVGGG